MKLNAVTSHYNYQEMNHCFKKKEKEKGNESLISIRRKRYVVTLFNI